MRGMIQNGRFRSENLNHKEAPAVRCAISRSVGAVALGLVAFATTAHAADQTYDPTNPAQVWDGATLNWDGSTAAWSNGNNAIFGGTGETVDVNGAITVGNLTFNANGYNIVDTGNDGTLSLTGTPSTITVTNASDNATISEVLDTGTGGLTKAGAGTLVLGGGNTYTGATTLSAGTLRLTNPGALTDSALTVASGTTLALRSDAPATFATNGVTLSSSTINVDGTGVGTGQTLTLGGAVSLNANSTVNITSASDDTLELGNIAGLGGNNTLTLNAAGANVSVAKLTATGGGDSGLVLAGNSNFTFGVLQNGGTNRELNPTINTSGTVTINGSTSSNINQDGGSNNNAVVTMNNGTLLLDFSNLTTPTNLITRGGTHSTTYFRLGGGALEINGKTGTTATSQNFFGGTTFNAGASAISIANNGTSTTTLTLNGITRNVGGTVDLSSSAGVFGADSKFTTSTLVNVGGILGGYATVGGSTWAVAPATSGQIITGLDDASYSNTGATALNLAASTANIDVAAAGSNASSISQVVNSLRFNDSTGPATVDATNGLTLTTGGILVTSNVGNNLSSITGGTLQGAAIADLVVIQNNAAAGLTIDSTIADNTAATALTKSGSGLLTLSNPTNTYTGKTYLNAGTLAIAADSSLGTAPGSATTDQLTLDGGALLFSGNFNLATTRGITVGIKGGALDTGAFSTAYAGVIDGVSATNGTLTKAGSGSLTLSGNNTYAGGTLVSNGTLLASSTSALGTGGVTVAGGLLASNVANVGSLAGLTLAGGSLSANGSDVGAFTLTANQAFAISAGTLDETIANAGSYDKVIGSGAGSFAISGGMLDLSSSTGIDYTQAYTLLSGFASGSVSGLNITGYDTANYTASLSDAGVLSFATAVPEPASLGMLGVAAVSLLRRRRRSARKPV